MNPHQRERERGIDRREGGRGERGGLEREREREGGGREGRRDRERERERPREREHRGEREREREKRERKERRSLSREALSRFPLTLLAIFSLLSLLSRAPLSLSSPSLSLLSLPLPHFAPALSLSLSDLSLALLRSPLERGIERDPVNRCRRTETNGSYPFAQWGQQREQVFGSSERIRIMGRKARDRLVCVCLLNDLKWL